jgi:hypothetical protein
MPGDCLGIGQPSADLDNVADRPPSCRIRNQSRVADFGKRFWKALETADPLTILRPLAF